MNNEKFRPNENKVEKIRKKYKRENNEKVIVFLKNKIRILSKENKRNLVEGDDIGYKVQVHNNINEQLLKWSKALVGKHE